MFQFSLLSVTFSALLFITSAFAEDGVHIKRLIPSGFQDVSYEVIQGGEELCEPDGKEGYRLTSEAQSKALVYLQYGNSAYFERIDAAYSSSMRLGGYLMTCWGKPGPGGMLSWTL